VGGGRHSGGGGRIGGGGEGPESEGIKQDCKDGKKATGGDEPGKV